MAFIKKGQQEEVFIKNKDADLDTANVAVANITTLFVDTQEVSDLEVKGTLQVTGTPFTVDWTDVTAEQKTITLNDVPAPANPTDTNADQGGIILKGSTDKTILYDQITDSWTFTPEITTASLSDVDLTTNAPQPDEALIWDQTLNTGAGGWKPGNVDPTSIDFSIIQNLPTDLTGYGIIASIDDLSDVDTSTVAPTADQILIWNAQANSGTGGWEPADNVPGSIDWSTVTNTPTDLAGYGITDALTTSSTLDDLVGVDITTTPPTADQILKFDATLGANGEWVPADNVPPSVDWSTITNQPALSDLVGYNIVLTTGSTLNQLADISNVTPTADQILKYSPGSGWLIVDNVADEVDWANVTGTPTTLSGYNISDALNSATALINDLNDVDTTGLQANQVLKWDGSSNWIPTDATLSETVTSLTYNSSTHELTYTDESGTSTVVVDLSTYIDSIATITSGSFNSTTGIVTYTRTDNSTFTIDFSALLPGITYLSTLSDTNLTGANAPSDKEVLVWNQPSGSSGEWIAGKVDWSMVDNTPTNFTGYGIIANLDDLANVDTTGAALNKILIYNGTSWEVGDNVPGSIDWSTITNTPTNLAGYGITDALSSSTTLSDLVGVSTTAPTQDQILVFDSTNGWEPKDNVADAVDWSSITNKPTTVATSGLTDALDDTTRIQDLSNVSSTTPTAGQILIYHAVNGWEPSNIPAPTAVAWTSITGKPTDVATSGLTDALSTSSTLNDLSGVNVQGATQGQVLQFDSNNGWEPVTPATFSETVTALSYDNVNNILSYTDESNVTNTINLSYLIDQNLPFISSGSFDPATKLFTLTRDDGSSFTVNLAGLASIVSLSGLTDTDIAGTPTDQYVLTWDSSLGTSGKWTAAAIPTPSSLQYINDISNVDAPTALLDQALLFNPSSGNWEASDIIWSKIKQTPTTVSASGLTDALSTSSTLGDLSGVDLTTIVPTVGKALVYDGNNWIPDILTVSNITMDIGDLQDVNTTNPIQAAVQGSALVWTWNGSNFEWQPGTLQAYIGDLFDVDTTTAPQTNELLVWDSGSSKWKPGKVDWTMVDNTPTDLAGYGITDSVMISGVNVINDLADINSTAPSDGEVLTWDATASEWKPEVIASPTSVAWSVITGTPTDFSGYGIVASIDDLSDVDTSTNTPTNNQVLTWDSSLNSGSGGWKPADVPPATETLTTLVYDTLNNNLIYTDENSQVTTISLAQFVDTNLSRITSGTYNSSTNKIRFDRSADNTFVEVDLSALVSGAGASVLTDLTDVQIVNANLTGDELLSYDNSTSLWKAVAKSSVIPTSIGSFSDVDLTGITSGQVLKWVNNKFEAADDVGGSSYADSDVDTHLNTFSATSGQILSWNGTDYAWVADQIGSNYADSDVDSHLNVSGVTTGHVLSWNGTDYAWVAQSGGSGGGSSTLAGLTDTNTTNHPPVATNVLTWTANNTWEPQEIPAGFDGDYNSLTNKPTLYADSDVNTLLNQSSATSGQILSWNGTDYAWVADQTGSGSGYADSDVDSHLNVSGATTGQILSWNGTDYAWVADQTGSGGSSTLAGLSDTNTTNHPPQATDVLTWTANNTWEPQEIPAGFDGDYNSLTNKPTLYVDSDVDTHLNQSSATTGQILSWNGTDYAWVADQTGSGYADSDVDTHLNVSGATTGQILSWNGSDYAWVADQTGSSGSSTLAGLSDTNTTNHPPVATNVLTWTANNTWEPQEIPAGFDGDYNNLTNKPTLYADSDVDTHLNVSGATTGQILSWNGSDYAWVADQTGSGYSDSDVDTHLNVSGATTGQILSWNGSDYAWVADQTGSTIVPNSAIAETGVEVEIIVKVSSKTANHRYNGQGSGSGYIFTIDGIDYESPFLDLVPGKTYKFNQDDSSNSSHGIRFYEDAAKTTLYSTGVTISGNAGSSGAYTSIAVTTSTLSILHYQCVNHGYMGNQVQVKGVSGSSVSAIDDLSDVDITTITPSATDVLTWTANNTWEPQEAPSGGGGSSVADITDLSDVDTTTNTPSQGTVLLYTANNLWEPATSRSFGTSHYRYDVPWANGGYDFSLSANDQSTISTGSAYDTWSTRTSSAHPHLESMAIGSYFLLTQHSGYPSYTPGGVGLYRKYADHTVSNSANNTRDYYFTFIGGSFRPTVLNNSTTIMSIHVLDSNIVKTPTESNNNFKFEIWDNKSGTPSYQTTIDSPILPASLGNLADVQLNWSGTSLTTTGPVANNVLQYSANGYWQAIEPVIDNLADVDTVSITPSDGDVLTWDGTINQWKPLASQLGSVASITELGDVDTTTIVPSINDVLVWTANNTFETQNAGTFWKYNVPWASGGYDFSLSANDQSTISTGSAYDTWSVRTGSAQPHLESMAIGSYFLLTQHSGYPSYTPGGVGLYRKYADHIVSNSANNTRDYYFTFISGSFRPTVLNNSITIMSIHVLDSNIVTTESDNNFKFEIWDNRSGTPSYQGTIESPIIPASLGNLADVQLNWSGTSLTTTGPVANNVLQYSANGYWQAIEQVIDNLADVDTVSIAPSDGDVLTWDATTSQWKPLASALGSVASIDELGDVDTTTIVPSINDVLVWTANNTFETQDPGAFFRYDAPWPSTYNMGISANDQSTISTGSTYDTWTTRTSSVKNTLGSIKVGEYFLMTNHSGYPSYTPGGVSLFRCYQEYTVTNSANDTRAYYITHIDGDCRPTATNNGTQLFSVHKISNSRLYGNNNFKLEVFDNKSGTPSYQRTINVPKLPVSLDDLMDVQIDFTGSSSSVTGPTTGDVLTWSANGFWQAMESAGGGSGSYADSDVDTHLNVSSATSGQVLSWNGTDYAWQTGSGGSSTLSGLTDTDTTTHAPQANDVLTWTANSTWEPQQSSSAITIGNLTDVDTTTNVPSNFDVLMWTTNNKWEPTEVVGINSIETHKLDVSFGTSGNGSYLTSNAGAGVVTGTTHDTIIFNNNDYLSSPLFGNLEPGELFWFSHWGSNNTGLSDVGLYEVVSNVYVHTNNRVDIKHIAGWRLTSIGQTAVYLNTTKFDKSILSGSATYELRNSDNSNAVIDEFIIPYNEAYPVHLGLLSNVDTSTISPQATDVLTWTANNTWEPQENPSITSASIDGLTDVDTTTHPPNLADQLVWTANNTWEPQEIPPIEIHKLDVSFGTSGHSSYLTSNAGAGVSTGSTHDTITFNNTDNLSSALFGSRQIGELFWLTHWGSNNTGLSDVGLYRMVSNVYNATNNRVDIKHIAGWRLTSIGQTAVYLNTSDFNTDLKLSGYAEFEIRNSDNSSNVINNAVISYDEAYPVHLGHLADVGDSALGSIVAGDVLTWTANNTWEPQQATGGSGGGSYADSDVDTHLNVSAATSGQILSWNGSDYAWVADQTGSGGGGSVTKTTDLTGDVSSTVATAGQILMWDGGTGKYVPTDGHLRSFSDVASTQPSDKEVLRWNVTNGEYESQLFPDFYTTIGNNQTPAVNSLLGWTANNAWEPVEPSAGINGDLDVLTDVTYNNRSNQSPSLDDVIQWTANNAWEPMTPPQGFDGDYNSLTNQPTIDDLYPTTRADYFGSINHDMIPSSNEVYDLGSSTKKWKDLFLSGTTINLGTINLKSTSTGGFQIQKAAAVGGGNPGDPAPLDTDVDWSNITNVPTTILGYGITDSADISTVDNVGDVDTTTVSATEGTVLTWTANNAWEPQLTQTASSNSRLKVIVCDGQSNTYQVNHKAGNVDIILNGIFMIPQITDWSDTTGTNNLSSGEYDYQSGTWDASTTTFTASSGAQADATHFKFSFIPDLNDKLMIRSY